MRPPDRLGGRAARGPVHRQRGYAEQAGELGDRESAPASRRRFGEEVAESRNASPAGGRFLWMGGAGAGRDSAAWQTATVCARLHSGSQPPRRWPAPRPPNKARDAPRPGSPRRPGHCGRRARTVVVQSDCVCGTFQSRPSRLLCTPPALQPLGTMSRLVKWHQAVANKGMRNDH